MLIRNLWPEPPYLNWSTVVYGIRKTEHGKQASMVGIIFAFEIRDPVRVTLEAYWPCDELVVVGPDCWLGGEWKRLPEAIR